MKAYEKYKSSGIAWIDDIPLDWEMWRVSKSFKRIGSGTTPTSGNSKYYDGGKTEIG